MQIKNLPSITICYDCRGSHFKIVISRRISISCPIKDNRLTLTMNTQDNNNLLNTAPVPFGRRPTKPRPTVPGVRPPPPDYLNPLLLERGGTISKALKYSKKLKPVAKAAFIEALSDVSHPWLHDEELTPTGKDQRHDRSATLESRYYKAAKETLNPQSYSDAVEE